MFQLAQTRQKSSSHDVISRIFKFQPVEILSVSGDCIRFTFKIRQTVTGTSVIRQFHDFFWRVLTFETNVRRARQGEPREERT